MKIWAHRGCSLAYPENTLLSFSKAVEIKGLTGIEFDIQLTSDGHIVICHDERVDRTTNGVGRITDMSLSKIKKLKINSINGTYEEIPTIYELLELVKTSNILLNIELKNSIIPYEDMEEKIINIIYDYKLENNVVYSSFNFESLKLIREIDNKANIAVLDVNVSDCIKKMKQIDANAIHPSFAGIDLSKDKFEGYTVRAWGGGKLYPEESSNRILDIESLEKKGITDVFLNEPEKYLL